MTSPYAAVAHSSALGLSTINGLPAHILIVHAVVVLVPLTAIGLVAALKPRLAQRLGSWLPTLSALAFLSVLAAMNAGDWLEQHVNDDSLVRHHTAIAGQLWPFSAAAFALSVVVWWLNGRSSTTAESDTAPIGLRQVGIMAGGTVATVVIGVLAVLVAIGSIVQVVRIGDSGSKASWHDHYSQTTIGRQDGGG